MKIIKKIKNIKPDSDEAWTFIVSYSLIWLVLIPLIMLIFCFITEDDYIGNLKINWPVTTLIIYSSVIYPYSFIRKNERSGNLGWTKVGTDEIGMLLIFDKPIIEVGPGLKVVPPFFTLRVDSVKPRTETFTISKIDTNSPELVNYKALKIKREDYENDDWHIRTSLGATVNFIYSINKGEYANYLMNLGNVDEIKESMLAILKRALSGEFSKRTLSIILNQRDQIDKGMKTMAQKMVNGDGEPTKSWGLKIFMLQMTDVNIPSQILSMTESKVLHNMEMYIQITHAEKMGKITEINALAFEFKEFHEGRGAAARERFMFKAKAVGEKLLVEARLLAKAKGYGAIAKALKMKEPDLMLRLDTAEKMFEKTEKMIISSPEIASVFSFLPLLGDAIKQVKSA